MKMFWFALPISIVVLFFNPPEARAESIEKLHVVASTSIIADWIENITGDLVSVAVLVGADSDTHTFEPSPADSVALLKAQLIFENGFGLEGWMDQLYEASGSKAQRIILAKSVLKQPLTIEREIFGEHEDIDPHLWHNVRYAMAMVKVINQALKKTDAVHADLYEANTQKYLKQLQELDAWIMRNVSGIPAKNRKIVTNHDSLGYFCERYQFQMIGAAFDSVTTEAEDASAKKMVGLIFKIKNSGVPTVFTENIHNSRIIASLASEANVKLGAPLYTDALGRQGTTGDSYIKMMRYNVQTIVEGLRK